MSSDNRYAFNGSAVGFAAHLHHFNDEPIFVDTCFEGSAALPPTGGCLQSKSGPREVRDEKHGVLLSFESSFASAKGDLPGFSGRSETGYPAGKPPLSPRVELSTSVTGLKVGVNGLEIDHLSSHFLAEDPRNLEDRHEKREVAFSALAQPQILGIRVGGKPLTIEFNPILVNVPTQRELIRELGKDPAFRKKYEHKFLGIWPTDDVDVPLAHGYIVTSIVKRISFGDRRLDSELIRDTNQVHLDGFGTIFFGELRVGISSRELSLVRVQLGSDVKGDVSACSCASKPDPNPTP